MIDRAMELVRGLVGLERAEGVVRCVDAGALRRVLDLEPGAEGVGEEELIARLSAVIEATPRTSTRRFWNQLFGGRDDAAFVGEVIAAALNSSMYTYKVAGPHALIERVLTDRMARAVGFGSGEGVFAPGGSISNMCAMILARDRVRPEYSIAGSGAERLGIYTSELCHYSIEKNAALVGIGRENVRKIETDGRGRMVPGALERAIVSDRGEGVVPTMVVATAGTTVLGAFDPIDAITAIAHHHGAWAHVDGAYGASVCLSPAHRRLMEGAGSADSLAWCAHKMMGVPLSCSVLLVREKGLLTQSYAQDASYLFQSGEDEFDFGTRSIQCGRRNDALKLWCAWVKHGDAGYAARIDRLFELAGVCADMIRADGELSLKKEPESVNVCFTVRGVCAEAVCDKLLEEGLAVVGYAVVDGEKVVRVPFVNPAMDEGDIRVLLDDIKGVAAQLRGA